jgi:hypothetical protein
MSGMTSLYESAAPTSGRSCTLCMELVSGVERDEESLKLLNLNCELSRSDLPTYFGTNFALNVSLFAPPNKSGTSSQLFWTQQGCLSHLRPTIDRSLGGKPLEIDEGGTDREQAVEREEGPPQKDECYCQWANMDRVVGLSVRARLSRPGLLESLLYLSIFLQEKTEFLLTGV